jgi:hypothetical protein
VIQSWKRFEQPETGTAFYAINPQLTPSPATFNHRNMSRLKFWMIEIRG